jgi:hypothetical protein
MQVEMNADIQKHDAETLAEAVGVIGNKTGKELLTDDDLLTLACAEIAHTYTRDEKGYS